MEQLVGERPTGVRWVCGRTVEHDADLCVRSLSSMTSRFDTHEVVNQPPELVGYSVFAGDVAGRGARA